MTWIDDCIYRVHWLAPTGHCGCGRLCTYQQATDAIEVVNLYPDTMVGDWQHWVDVG